MEDNLQIPEWVNGPKKQTYYTFSLLFEDAGSREWGFFADGEEDLMERIADDFPTAVAVFVY